MTGMSGYTKLFGSIIHSTIWREPAHVRLVWVTMLAMSDSQGVVESSLPGLADASRVSLEECQEALEVLSSTDKYSRSQEYEGRRIEAVQGGWLILNYLKYRAVRDEEKRREQNREAQKRARDRQQCQPRQPESAQAEAEAEAEADKKTDTSTSSTSATATAVRDVFDHWVAVMSKPGAKLVAARRSKVQARLREGYTVEQLKQAIDGCRLSQFHMGENDSSKPYNDLKTILRDGGTVEAHIERLTAPARSRSGVAPCATEADFEGVQDDFDKLARGAR